MVSLITSSKAQIQISKNMKALRLEKGFTQEGLSKRSGVAVSSLRKFEQKGAISLESFLKLAMALGCVKKIIEATESQPNNFSSIDEVLKENSDKKPKRGWRK